jgi:tetratricopeptide (TPR) repeat protein
VIALAKLAEVSDEELRLPQLERELPELSATETQDLLLKISTAFNTASSGTNVGPDLLVGWQRAMEALFAAARVARNSAVVEYTAQTRMQLLVDGLADYRSAILWGRIALEHVKAAGARQVIHGDIAIAHLMLGELELAESHLKIAIREAEAGSLPYWTARHRGNLGVVRVRQGRLEEALTEYDSALALGRAQPEFDLEEKFAQDRAEIVRALER